MTFVSLTYAGLVVCKKLAASGFSAFYAAFSPFYSPPTTALKVVSMEKQQERAA